MCLSDRNAPACSRPITLPKVIWPDMHKYLTCVLSWYIYIKNFNSKYPRMTEAMSRNCELLEFFLKSKWLNSSNKYSTRTKYKPDQHVFSTYLYPKQFKMPMYDWDNKWKLNCLKFIKSKGRNSAKHLFDWNHITS